MFHMISDTASFLISSDILDITLRLERSVANDSRSTVLKFVQRLGRFFSILGTLFIVGLEVYQG